MSRDEAIKEICQTADNIKDNLVIKFMSQDMLPNLIAMAINSAKNNDELRTQLIKVAAVCLMRAEKL